MTKLARPKELDSYISPNSKGSPGDLSSFPVEIIAIVNGLTTFKFWCPIVAQRLIREGVSRAPADKPTSPFAIFSPRFRIKWGLEGSVKVTSFPLIWHFSIGIMASEPWGIGDPVVIEQASPFMIVGRFVSPCA